MCCTVVVVVNRRQTPGVKGGRVQKKNNWHLSAHYSQVPGLGFVIDRERPGKGYRHLLLQSHVERFVALVPDWAELSIGLDAIVLAEGDQDCHGWHDEGVIGVCAWPRGLTETVTHRYAADHRQILEQLDVPVRRAGSETRIEWTEETVRAFQLVHVLLHELGHHHDRMTTRSKREAARGESYPETYAHDPGAQIWAGYVAEFGLPSSQ